MTLVMLCFRGKRGGLVGPALLFPGPDGTELMRRLASSQHYSQEPHFTGLGITHKNPTDQNERHLHDKLAECHACMDRCLLGVPGVKDPCGVRSLLSLEEEGVPKDSSPSPTPLPFLGRSQK